MCTDGRRCSSCPARRLNAGSREIGAALPALGTVVSCTANDAALLSHTGEYAVPAHPGEALLCGQEQISVRLGAGVTGYLTPRALTLTEAFGTHRAYLTPMSDPLVVKGLSLAPRGPQVAHTAEDWLGVDWNDTDQIDHLDSLSPERYRVLERFYRLPEPLIGRFYAGRSTFADRLRILAGRPPVSVRRAVAAVMEKQ